MQHVGKHTIRMHNADVLKILDDALNHKETIMMIVQLALNRERAANQQPAVQVLDIRPDDREDCTHIVITTV